MAKKAVLKTKETEASVDDFINAITDETKRKDCFTIIKLMQKVTKDKAKMWGSAMVGFGNTVFKSPKTGREVDWFKIGFSPRKANITLYLITDYKKQTENLKKLGRHKLGGGCLYLNGLAGVDLKVLETIITAAAKEK